jgi:hypothetical protein
LRSVKVIKVADMTDAPYADLPRLSIAERRAQLAMRPVDYAARLEQ